MVSTPRSSTESSARPGPSAAGAPPRARNQTRRNTQRLDEALGGPPDDAHTIVPPDVITLPDRERVFATPRSGDWILLGIMLVTLLGCGGYVWYRLGLHDHIGRAVFFGLALVCLYWTALIYTFKLSLSVHVGPQGISVVRGPWRMELRWGDVSRLMERAQLLDGRRYRWVVAQGRDERRIQVREDMVTDYARFRLEVYERYRLWRDHGGAWGTTSGGPFTASESVGDEIRWWLIGASITALPGAYFWLLLPETNPLGMALVAIAAVCVAMSLRAILLRQVYVVDSRMILARYLIGKAQLSWRDISRVERSRNPASWLIRGVAAMCRVAIAAAARSEVGLRSFPWSPRVPEYLTLRGAGRHVRVRLHRLARPDELLAWIEFYERVGRRPGGTQTRPRQAPPTAPLGDERVAAATIPLDDLSDEDGLRDPWAAGAAPGADPIDLPTVPTPTVGAEPHAAYDDEYEDEDEDDDYQDDDEDVGPVVARTPEELEDAWLISTNKRPTVLAPDAQPMAETTPPAESPYERRERLRQERVERERAFADEVARHGSSAPGVPSGPGAADGYGGDVRPPRPNISAHPTPPAGEPAAPPVWNFPEPPPVAQPAEPPAGADKPAVTSSTFAAFSREDLLAEMGALGPAAAPPSSGVVAPPPPPRNAPPKHSPQPVSQPRRSEAPTPEIADAPTAALEAVPPGRLAPQADDLAADDDHMAGADDPGEHQEPERPWLREGWQPPALPRFGPGTRSPFHNPDDAD